MRAEGHRKLHHIGPETSVIIVPSLAMIRGRSVAAFSLLPVEEKGERFHTMPLLHSRRTFTEPLLDTESAKVVDVVGADAGAHRWRRRWRWRWTRDGDGDGVGEGLVDRGAKVRPS